MKKIFFLAIFFTILIGTSCRAQKMMNSVNDAIKLQDNKRQFIGKLFKKLLNQITPEIKYYYGNPDNKGESIAGTCIKFYFVSKEDYKKVNEDINKPTGILVCFKLEPKNNREPIPIGGRDWTGTETKEYGDMIVTNIYVTGKD